MSEPLPPSPTLDVHRSPSDSELAVAARQGDKRAFVQIVTRHQAMVCGIALSILGDFASSEDAGQEAFLLAWRRIHELRDPERLRAWLGQIARHAALAQLRRRRPHENLEDAPPLPDAGRTPDEAAACEEEASLVREHLARLPEIYRLPLILYYREGQSVRQAAEALGLGEDALKQRLARGREMLREHIAVRIETALIRTAPTALFTMAIATAIGALAQPAAVAGSAFAAAAASAPPTAGNLLTPLVTAMSTSKIVTTAAACLVAAICVPIGYGLHPRPTPVGSDAAPPSTPVRSPEVPARPAEPPSVLLAEWHALHARHGTNAAAMPRILQAISELTDPFRRRAFRTALVSEWVELDPAGGLSFFLASGRHAAQRRQLFLEWLTRDPRSAIDALMAAGGAGHELARDCLTDVARLAPDRVPEIASRLPSPEGYWERQVQEAFNLLAERDPVAARRAAEGLPPANRGQALEGVAQAWGKTAFSDAVAWARALPEGIDRDEVIRAALVGRASVDPAGALESAGMVPAGGRYAHFATTTGARVLTAAAKTDFELTARWLAAHPGQFGHEDLIGLATTVTERLNADPAAFLNARADDGSLAAMLPAISSALLNDGGGQRAAIWDWLKAQPRTAATEEITRRVLDSAGYQEPALALRLATDLPGGPEGDRLVSQLAQALLNGGRAIDRYPALYDQAPERLRAALTDAAFNHGLRGDTLDNPHAWVSRLSQLPEHSRDQARTSLSRAWGEQNPMEALAWASALPPGNGQTEAIAAVVGAWATQDAPGAAQWLNTLPAGPRRDRGAESLASAIASTYPQDAWTWTLAIQDPTVRVRAATGTLRRVARRDLATARHWIETGPFTAADKQHLHAAAGEAARNKR